MSTGPADVTPGLIGGAMLATADKAFVDDYLEQTAAALAAYRDDAGQIGLLERITAAMTESFRQGGKLLIMGNGGSAGDSQHIAGEFTGRMLYNRDPLPAVALTTDTSALTAIGNDYGFEKVFERQVLALAGPQDVVMGLSTSGNSPNVVLGLQAARKRGARTVGFTGRNGGAMAELSDLLLLAPSSLTPVIQQVHMVAAHIVCSLVERAMFPKPV